MSHFTSEDFHAFNRASLVLHETHSAQELPWQIHKAVRSIIDGEMVGVNWVDPRTSVSLGCRYFPENVISPEQDAVAQTLLPIQLPMWLKCARKAHSVSEFLSCRVWERRDIYQGLQQFSLVEHLVVDVPITSSLTLMIAVLRGRFSTYTATDRLKLTLLAPHIRKVCDRLSAQGEITATSPVVRRHERVTVSRDGSAEWSDAARGILATYGIPVSRDRLPPVLDSWHRSQELALSARKDVCQPAQPLIIKRQNRSLRVYLCPNWRGQGCDLLLQEIEHSVAPRPLFAELGISKRESEVLHWLAEGKTNGEIAVILGISDGTVKRHLENCYRKLGVENRHAATVLVTRAISAQKRV